MTTLQKTERSEKVETSTKPSTCSICFTQTDKLHQATSKRTRFASTYNLCDECLGSFDSTVNIYEWDVKELY